MQAHRKRVKKYLSVGAVTDRYDVTPSTIWRWSNEERFASLGFPKPLRIGLQARRWGEDELTKYDARRAAMRDAEVAAKTPVMNPADAPDQVA